MFDQPVVLGEEENNFDVLVEDLSNDNNPAVFDDTNIDPEPKPELTPEPTSEPKLQEETTTNWLDQFNKEIGTSYSSPDEVKASLSKKDETLKGEYDLLKAKHEKLISEFQKTDPKGYFSNDTEIKKSLYVKSNPSISGEVVDKLFSLDLEKGNPLDIIAAGLMLNHKSFSSGEAAKAYFLKEHGIESDFDVDDLDDFQKTRINLAAESAAKQIQELRNGVSIPEFKSIDEILADVSIGNEPKFDINTWDGKIDSLVNSINDIEIKDGDFLYKEAIDKDFKEKLPALIRETIIEEKIDPTPENIAELKDTIENLYYAENKVQIIKRAVAQETFKIKEQLHKEIHNDVDPDKTPTPPPPANGKTTDLLSSWGIPH